MPNPNSYHHLLPTRYQPGSNGRPRFGTGHHAGLAQVAKRLRKTTKNGKEVCDFLLGVMRDPAVRMGVRIQAAELILAYSYGKPRETIELVDDTVSVDRRALVDALSIEDQTTLRDLIHRALERAQAPVIDAASTPVIVDGDDEPLASEPGAPGA
jgi:hypothetical protein